MSGRNLTNGAGFANRNLNNTNVNQLSDITADLPVIYDTDFKISLKGLSTLGASDAGKVIKVSSGGNSLEYATDIARTDAEIRGLFSGISPISYNNSNGQISTTFTASSSDTLTNKSGSNSMFSNDELYIKLTNLSASTPLSYDNTTGAFTTTFTASSSDTLTNKSGNISMFSNDESYIKLTSLSASNPITYNNSTGAIGFTNSNNYIALTNLSASAPLSYDNTTGAFTTTFTASSSDTLTNKSGNISMFSNDELYIKLTNLSASAPLSYNNSTGAFTTTFTASSSDTLTNKSGNISMFSNDESYIKLTNLSASAPLSYNNSTGAFTTTFTASSSDTLTNKSGNISMFSNDESYIKLTSLSASAPLSYNNSTGAISLTGLSGFTANKFLKVNSSGDGIEYADDNQVDLTTSQNFGTSASGMVTLGNSSQITKIEGNINIAGTLFTTLKCDNGLEVSNGSSSAGMIFFKENSTNGSHYIMLQGQASVGQNFTLTLPAITDTLITKDSVDVLTNKSISYSQITSQPTIPNLQTATEFGTSATNTITIGASNRQIEFEATNYTFTDTNGTSVLKITDSDVEINGADFGIKARSATDPPRLYFWDSDRSHYIVLQGQEVGGNATLTLPHTTATLAYQGMPIAGFTNNAGYITASSTETLTNKSGNVSMFNNDANYITSADVGSQIASAENISTSSILGNPNRTFGNSSCANIVNGTSTTISNLICTGTSGDNARITLKDRSLDHNCIIKCVEFDADRTFYFPNEGGTFLTSGTASSASIRGLFSGTSPISLNVSTGVISTSFTNSSSDNLSNKTFITPLDILVSNTTSFYIAEWFASSIGNGHSVEFVIGKNHNASNCGAINYYHDSDGDDSNYLGFGTKTHENAIKIYGNGYICLENQVNMKGESYVDNTFYADRYRLNHTGGYFETYADQLMYFGTANNGGNTYFYYNNSLSKIISAGNWTTFSDERLKTDIKKGDEVEKEMADYFDKIEVNKYGYIPQYAGSKGTTPENKNNFGFIAQQVEQVYPDGVGNSGTGIFPSPKSTYEPKVEFEDVLAIDKEKVNMLLWGKVKQMDKLINQQQAQISQQQAIIDKLLSSNSFKEFKS